MWEILAEILDGSQCILQRIVQKISSEVEIFCNVNLAGESSRWVAWKKDKPPTRILNSIIKQAAQVETAMLPDTAIAQEKVADFWYLFCIHYHDCQSARSQVCFFFKT